MVLMKNIYIGIIVFFFSKLVVEDWEFAKAISEMDAANKLPLQAHEIVLGIKESALSRRSFLSAASFEQTTKVLINAALKGSVDRLRGLKEKYLGHLVRV